MGYRGRGCEETAKAITCREPKVWAELVSHIMAPLVSSQTPYMYDTAKGHAAVMNQTYSEVSAGDAVQL